MNQTKSGGTDASYALSAVLTAMIVLFAALPGASAAPVYRFLPIGDSYTIGAGVSEAERWPDQLVRRMPALRLIGNPARSGWTTADALQGELPLAVREKPDLITLLIGTNDWVQGTPPDLFRSRLSRLIDGLQEALAPGGILILITVPNFENTPSGAAFGGEKSISWGLKEFNVIIRDEAKKREIPVAELFDISTRANTEPGMLVEDGLHPSGKQYQLWIEQIAPVVETALKKK